MEQLSSGLCCVEFEDFELAAQAVCCCFLFPYVAFDVAPDAAFDVAPDAKPFFGVLCVKKLNPLSEVFDLLLSEFGHFISPFGLMRRVAPWGVPSICGGGF